MGLKRKLFPESSTGLIPDGLVAQQVAENRKTNALGPYRQKKLSKEKATAAKIVTCDSLATILPETRRGKRQRSNNNQSKNHKDGINCMFELSVLMALDSKESTNNTRGKARRKTNQRKRGNTTQMQVLDVKENISNGNNISTRESARRKTKQRRKGNPIKTQVTEVLEKERRLSSNSVGGGMLTRLKANGRSRKMHRSRSLTKKRTQSNSKRNRNTKKTIERANPKDLIQNVDSLLMCLAKTSTTNKTLKPRLVNTQNISKQSIKKGKLHKTQPLKPSNQRIKRTGKHQSIIQSSTGESSIKVSTLGRKSRHKPKEENNISCETCGLGAFVGITTEIRPNRNSRKEKSKKRLVSPLESNFKKNSIPSENDQELAALYPAIINMTRDTTVDTAEPDKVPTVIIVPIAQQSEQLIETTTKSDKNQLNLVINSDEDAILAESRVEIRQSVASSKKISTIQTQSKHKSSVASPHCLKGIEKKTLHPKYDVGTKFEKYFHSHGWFIGTVVAFGSESGFYSVRYEDKDTEELEEFELDKCKIQSVGPMGADDDEQRRLETNSTIHKNEPKPLRYLTDSSKQNRKIYSSELDGLNLDGASSKTSNKIIQSTSSPKKKQLVKQHTPPRKSRRRSSEPTRRLGSTYSDNRIEEMNVSTRRSKRRRSEPTRLIDSACTEYQQTTQSTGRKNRKVLGQKPKRKTLKNHDSIDSKNTINTQKCPKKEHFDDALRAVMPVDDYDELASGSGQTEDNIFNSTPTRKLFTRNHSNDPESCTNRERRQEERCAGRRSTRESIEPQRYGDYLDSVTKASEKHTKLSLSVSKSTKKNAQPAHSAPKSSKKKTKSVLKKKKMKSKRNSKAEKQVQIIDKRPEEADDDSDSISKENDSWTQTDLRILHKAHRTVDPMSFSFWEDVAEIVGQKSAMECREKWFSLAKTPEPKQSKSKKQDKGKIITTTKNPRNVDDDIFNSTPMRSAFGIGENVDPSAIAFEELGDISKMNVGSAIKIHKLNHNDDSILPSNNEPMAYPRGYSYGYKTYLQNLGRSMRQKDLKKKSETCESPNRPPLQLGKKLAEHVHEGDVEVKCRLSPGGTLQVDTFGDTDKEDYLDDDETDDDMCKNFY